jgi:3-oxoadipate enol-lactonase
MEDVLINDTVNVRILGRGPTLILLHSLLADRDSFRLIAEPLAERFRVVVPELPGFGKSAWAPGGLAAVADRIADMARGIAEGGRPIVLGNGYGGFVALQMAIRHAGLASRFVFADCGARFSEPGREAFRMMAKIAGEKGLAAISEVAMRRLFAPDFQAAHPDLMAERRAAFLKTDPTVFEEACQALASLDLTGDLARVKVPALVLVGEEDEATPKPMSIALAEGLPDARLIILPHCAHVPQMQAPAEFLAAIDGFISAES